MSTSEWNKVDFQEFIDRYDKNVILENAPKILYSKKDKEPEAFFSLIALFFLTGGLFIYIALSIIFNLISFSLLIFIVIIVIVAIIDAFLITNYILSNIPIRLLECWVEIYEGPSRENKTFYCFSYYPIFSGKSLPNKAKNAIFKLYQDEVLKSKIDITQIEIYINISKEPQLNFKTLGFFFQYGEGLPFKAENIDRNSWRYFPFEKSFNENYLATANWDHQYEWRDDLELDYDKLHSYAPWVLQDWSESNLKPLTNQYKTNLLWDIRKLESIPKLEPWKGNIETQTYESFKSYKDIQMMNEAIERIIGTDVEIKKVKDIKNKLLEFKAYFRDLIL